MDGDPTPGVVEAVQALAKEFGDFAHDVEHSWSSLNSFGGDATALSWVGQTAEAFKASFGPLPGRLQKLYISYSEASDALAAYWPKLQAAQNNADSALRQGLDAQADLTRATGTAANAAADLKTAQAGTDPKSTADAQTSHDNAQKALSQAKDRLAALTAQAHQAHNDLQTAAKDCAKALHHSQSDGIHNKHWWQHVGQTLSDIGGKIAQWSGEIGQIAVVLAPVLNGIAILTVEVPGLDVVTASLAGADDLIAETAPEVTAAGLAIKATGDGLQGHWNDLAHDAVYLGASRIGGKGGSEGEDGVPPGAMAAQDESSAAEAAAPDPIPRGPGGGWNTNGRDPSELVPPYARQRPWTPAAPGQGAEDGVEWIWKERDANGDEIGPTIRLRVHSADPTAPAGSNAANGPIYRIQHGAKYQDADGNLHPQGIHNKDSPNYDEDAINDTHIPWPLILKLPW
ncbi:polymorphic toxin type 30 domain-containing protein [Catenulispora acidiphila]|uniref:polymorphic toxin type 30 domain-containing protein n=1 Tax=Catenulispora acidiphila TaxID=304895 RepID=UPI00117E45E8|nr:polymorphic toxin type 30 domain-containing protein [Catenulispora acidiphila]